MTADERVNLAAQLAREAGFDATAVFSTATTSPNSVRTSGRSRNSRRIGQAISEVDNSVVATW